MQPNTCGSILVTNFFFFFLEIYKYAQLLLLVQIFSHLNIFNSWGEGQTGGEDGWGQKKGGRGRAGEVSIRKVARGNHNRSRKF